MGLQNKSLKGAKLVHETEGKLEAIALAEVQDEIVVLMQKPQLVIQKI